MRGRLIPIGLVVGLWCGVALGQTVADLQKTVPYSEAVRLAPGLTYSDYLTILNKVAKENSAKGNTVASRSQAVRAPRVPQVPVYVPPASSPALGTTSTIGNTAFTNWSDGSSATSTRIGSNVFTNFSDGGSATKTQIGNTGFTNFSNGTSATSNQIGNIGFTNYSNGLSSTTTRIGNSTFTNFSDGSFATTTSIGNTGFTNYSSAPKLTLPPLTVPSITLPSLDNKANTRR
jgi:hypothetical protein